MKSSAVCILSCIASTVTVLAIQHQTGPLSRIQARPTGSSSGTTLVDDALSDIAAPRVYDSEGLAPDEAVAAFVYRANNRSVVNIATRIGGERGFLGENPTSDSGSGFIIDRFGHILTNHHVIEGAQRILVTLHDGVEYEAELVGLDPLNDLAVVRIQAPEKVLVPVRFSSSSGLLVGMRVFAIGNPFGLERTMTTGIISSLDRTLPVTRARSIKSVIQIDAAINPGNSGGPLLNSHGEVIGINTAIASRTGQNSGIGFAIPSNLLARIVPELLQHGRFIRPEFGIDEVARTDQGLRVTTIDPGGPAARAGIRGPEVQQKRRGIFVFESRDNSKADVIVGVNGKPTLQPDEFLSEVESHRPGDKITIEVLRNGQTISIPVLLE